MLHFIFPDGRDWLRGKLGLVLMGGAILSKSLISYQEASISLLSLSIRRQTDWKPQSQKTNQNVYVDHSLSNSMKLWAMPCRDTQDGQVMVESSDKTRSTGEENGKPLQYSCLENPMNSMKRHKIGHWKMNSPGR